MIGNYIRYVTKGFESFDPSLLAKETESIVCKKDQRKYLGFAVDPEYLSIATGYTVGCSLRCVFCGVDWSRDYPEKFGRFYSPKEAFDKLSILATKFGLKRLRISGAEPTISKTHLLKLMEYIENSRFRVFVLETNGTLLGLDRDFIEAISRFKKVHVRVSLKAGTPYDYARKTGAIPESFDVPFQAIQNLIDYKVRFNIAAVTDPRLMGQEERNQLLKKVKKINPHLLSTLEEEIIIPYKTTLARLKYAGFKWHEHLLPYNIAKIFLKSRFSHILERSRSHA